MSKKITVHVPATSANLGPGFDVLGVALKLYNEVTLETENTSWSSVKSPFPLEVYVQGEGANTLSRDGKNLVVRAAMRVFEQARRWPKSLKVNLVNRIPLSRGMGSSAAAVIGGICAANALIGAPLSQEAMLDLANGMEGHPDNIVPAFAGGFCLSGIIAGEVRYLKFQAPQNLRAVVCSPDKPLATKEARRVLPSRIPFSAAVFTSTRVAFLIGALLQKRYDLLGFAMEDVLHQPARARLIPGLQDAIQDARKAGALGAALSGAGSSVIALISGSNGKKVGEAMQKAFAFRGIASRWQELTFEGKGVRYK